MNKITIAGVVLVILMIAPASASINDFLAEDTTNEHIWEEWYTSGHYARDLARNASEHNISMGSMILGTKKMFKGYDNYIVSYVEIDGKYVIIDPHTDEIYELQRLGHYTYYRVYPDGTQVPSYWRANLAHTGIVQEYRG